MPKMPTEFDLGRSTGIGRRIDISGYSVASVGRVAEMQERTGRAWQIAADNVAGGLNKFGARMRAAEEKGKRKGRGGGGGGGGSGSAAEVHALFEGFKDDVAAYGKQSTDSMDNYTDDEVGAADFKEKDLAAFDDYWKPLFLGNEGEEVEDGVIGDRPGYLNSTVIGDKQKRSIDKTIRELRRLREKEIDERTRVRRRDMDNRTRMDALTGLWRERMLVPGANHQSLVEGKIAQIDTNKNLIEVERKGARASVYIAGADAYLEGLGWEEAEKILESKTTERSGEPKFFENLTSTDRKKLLKLAKDRKDKTDAKAALDATNAHTNLNLGILPKDGLAGPAITHLESSKDLGKRQLGYKTRAALDFNIMEYDGVKMRDAGPNERLAIVQREMDKAKRKPGGLTERDITYFAELASMSKTWGERQVNDPIGFSKTVNPGVIGAFNFKEPEASVEQRIQDSISLSNGSGEPVRYWDAQEAAYIVSEGARGNMRTIEAILARGGKHAPKMMAELVSITKSPEALAVYAMANAQRYGVDEATTNDFAAGASSKKKAKGRNTDRSYAPDKKGRVKDHAIVGDEIFDLNLSHIEAAGVRLYVDNVLEGMALRGVTIDEGAIRGVVSKMYGQRDEKDGSYGGLGPSKVTRNFQAPFMAGRLATDALGFVFGGDEEQRRIPVPGWARTDLFAFVTDGGISLDQWEDIAQFDNAAGEKIAIRPHFYEDGKRKEITDHQWRRAEYHHAAVDAYFITIDGKFVASGPDKKFKVDATNGSPFMQYVTGNFREVAGFGYTIGPVPGGSSK